MAGEGEEVGEHAQQVAEQDEHEREELAPLWADLLDAHRQDEVVAKLGPEGRKFFPFVFTLFFFILFGNLMGVFPLLFTFTSHIAVTLGLSLFVFLLVTFVGLKEHGLHFFSYFVP